MKKNLLLYGSILILLLAATACTEQAVVEPEKTVSPIVTEAVIETSISIISVADKAFVFDEYAFPEPTAFAKEAVEKTSLFSKKYFTFTADFLSGVTTEYFDSEGRIVQIISKSRSDEDASNSRYYEHYSSTVIKYDDADRMLEEKIYTIDLKNGADGKPYKVERLLEDSYFEYKQEGEQLLKLQYLKYLMSDSSNRQPIKLLKKWTYDKDGFLTAYEFHGDDPYEEYYSYDADGRLSISEKHCTFDVYKTVYEYDAKNNISKVTELINDEYTSFVEYSYDNRGNMVKATTSRGKVTNYTYEYDSEGNVLNEFKTNAGGRNKKQICYNYVYKTK